MFNRVFCLHFKVDKLFRYDFTLKSSYQFLSKNLQIATLKLQFSLIVLTIRCSYLDAGRCFSLGNFFLGLEINDFRRHRFFLWCDASLGDVFVPLKKIMVLSVDETEAIGVLGLSGRRFSQLRHSVAVKLRRPVDVCERRRWRRLRRWLLQHGLESVRIYRWETHRRRTRRRQTRMTEGDSVLDDLNVSSGINFHLQKFIAAIHYLLIQKKHQALI